MSVFASDTFTASDFVDLGSIPGSSWNMHPSYWGELIVYSNRTCTATHGFNEPPACYYYNAVPENADYSVECVMHYIGSANCLIGVAGRINNSQNTMYHCYFDEMAQEWQLFKIVNGTITGLGQASDSFSSGTRLLRLEMIDTSIKVFVDNVQQISVTDGSITAAGYAGLRYGATESYSTSDGQHLDEFAAYTAGGSPPSFGASAVSGGFSNNVIVPNYGGF